MSYEVRFMPGILWHLPVGVLWLGILRTCRFLYARALSLCLFGVVLRRLCESFRSELPTPSTPRALSFERNLARPTEVHCVSSYALLDLKQKRRIKEQRQIFWVNGPTLLYGNLEGQENHPEPKRFQIRLYRQQHCELHWTMA